MGGSSREDAFFLHLPFAAFPQHRWFPLHSVRWRSSCCGRRQEPLTAEENWRAAGIVEEGGSAAEPRPRPRL